MYQLLLHIGSPALDIHPKFLPWRCLIINCFDNEISNVVI